MIEPFEIDEDIGRARALPGEFYHRADWFERQRQSIFARSWQFVGDEQDLAGETNVRPGVILDGCLDEPIVLTRDADSTVRCLSNVCTHRGAIVAPADAVARRLACRYHGRTYALDGRCTHMPAFDGVVGFPAPEDSLRALALGRWDRLLFASLDPHVAFDALCGPLRDRLAFVPLASARLDAAASRTYEVPSHWALYCDNYLEGFHVPFVHAQSLGPVLDWDAYETHLFEHASLQVGIARGDEDAFRLPAGHADGVRRIAAYYVFLFPNTMLNFYPWGLSINVVTPRGPTASRVRYVTYVWDESLRTRGAGADLHRVEMEDEAIVASVQVGVRSRNYQRGRYSPTQERAVHHFHRQIAAAAFG